MGSWYARGVVGHASPIDMAALAVELAAEAAAAGGGSSGGESGVGTDAAVRLAAGDGGRFGRKRASSALNGRVRSGSVVGPGASRFSSVYSLRLPRCWITRS